MKLTYKDILDLECCVTSAMVDYKAKIAELKSQRLDNEETRIALQRREKMLNDYTELHGKLRLMEKEAENG